MVEIKGYTERRSEIVCVVVVIRGWGGGVGGGGGCTQVMGTKGDGLRKYRQEREVSKHGA